MKKQKAWMRKNIRTYFYNSLTLYFKIKLKKWLGNTRDFSFPISSSLQEWTSGAFNKNLVAAGLEKMALVIPTNLVANLSVQQTVDLMNTKHMDQKFETKYFDNVENAMDWLKN